ncbi:MAG: ATP-dependent helicase [Micromonosporaceae bacterium]|nr:ATP-dependent helicase [Micromonosporaceae bacterium]
MSEAGPLKRRVRGGGVFVVPPRQDGAVTSRKGRAEPLAGFSPATRAWFESAFAAPTPAQAASWAAIRAGQHTLTVAPTGSGKTLAAFLWSLDRLAAKPAPKDPGKRCRVLYVSPLKALAVDVERNLRAPLAGIRHAATLLGEAQPEIRVAMRTGDTPATERRAFSRTPPDILITTPESLFLLLTSAAREALRGVETVIVDEVHAVCATKRGTHLALSLERLDALLERPAQRIGLSATVRPVETAARFLGGAAPVEIVQPPAAKTIELTIEVPVEDMTELTSGDDGRKTSSIWPAVEERVLDLVLEHRSTIVFANSRRLAERLCARVNELYAERQGVALAVDQKHPPAELMAQSGQAYGASGIVARAHHGSVSREERKHIEEELKSGRLPAVVATSSLELGIDMGAVDLVVQVDAPPSVASGMQRIGRAGHHVGAVSKGVVFPKHRGDLAPAVTVAERMRSGQIEELSYPRNPLDVLAQQVVAMVSLDDWPVDRLAALVRRAAPFAEVSRSVLDAVLDMLAGRYPSTAFAELRPRLVWDRDGDVLRARPGAQRLAVTSGGTIPDRGLYGVFLAGAAKPVRVGELDEEMVYESRVGDVFLLGSTSWRIEEITHDRVLVSPAPGQPARMPFWKGDNPGRPAELGRAIGAMLRQLRRLSPDAAEERPRGAGLDAYAARNLLDYLAEQREAAGHVPDDRTVLVERFRDELGDWRLVVHCVLGARVTAGWALAIGARLQERHGFDGQVMPSDDGIVVRLPDTTDEPPGADLVVFDPEEIAGLVETAVGTSALFAARFRECAARALLLPRRDPRRRQPLWQQRQRAAQLLDVAREFPDFPITLEAARECLQDVLDLPALTDLMQGISSRSTRLVEVESRQPSPFARALLFGYVGTFLYGDDTPLAERRAAALALDATLLGELLGKAELRELLDPEAVAETARRLQWLTPDRAPRDAEDVAEMLRMLGDLSVAEATSRGARAEWLEELAGQRRAVVVRVAGEERWIIAEDAARYRDALGTALPMGLAEAHTAPVADPLGDLIGRYARTHAPFTAASCGARYGLPATAVDETLHRLAAAGRLSAGEFTPGVSGEEWCDVEVLRLLRRRSLAALRREIEPAPGQALASFLPGWQHVGAGVSGGGSADSLGVAGVAAAIEVLQGYPAPASALERLVLPARVSDYTPPQLDELTGSGDVVWAGAGALPGGDGWVILAPVENAPLLLPPPDAAAAEGPVHQAVLEALADGQAMFFRPLAERVGAVDDADLAQAIWDLVWSGHLSNDTLAPLRALLSGGGAHRGRPQPGRSRYRRPSRLDRGALGRGGRPALPSRGGLPTVAGRWHLLPERDLDPTRRAAAIAEVLVERHGVLTRGAVAAEGVAGGFAGVYPVLAALEERGAVRRGYFVEGLGAAQFAAPGAVDQLRDIAEHAERAELRREPAPAIVLAATDPANPYGAALPWPERAVDETGREDRPGRSGEHVPTGHRPGRKAGALVVLIGGRLALYVERGGRTVLSYLDDPAALETTAKALADAVRSGALGALSVERSDGAPVRSSPLGQALAAAGFRATPRGLRLRG